jgi:hypothetical protein
VDYFVVLAGQCEGGPASQRVTVLFDDSSDDVAMGYGHCPAWFVLCVEWYSTAGKFDSVVLEGLSCGIVAGLPYFKVCCI